MHGIVPRDQRLAAFEIALETFRQHYDVAEHTLRRLHDTLTSIPRDVASQERRLLAGLLARPSDAVDPEFNDRLLGVLKEIGWWKEYSPRGRDLLRKRLSRRGKLATTHGNVTNRRKGRPQYLYADLEKSYALAIAGTLNNTFPISRSADRKLYGAAFALLEAALSHALPYTGVSGDEGRAMRLRAIFRRGSDN